MKIVIFANPDGTITVRNPVLNAVTGPAVRRLDETDDEHFERMVAGQNRKGGTRVAVIEHTDLPTEHRHFKDARVWRNGRVEIDMPKARAIHMDRIRIERDKELERLDKVIAANEDAGPRDNANRAERQRLRDIPQTFDLSTAATPTELLALWPIGLPGKPS